MPRHSLTQEAEVDLNEIWDYVANLNFDSAGNLIDTLIERFILLAQNPFMGRSRSELRPNLRSFPVGSYVVLYQPTDSGVEIVRVLHGSRDIEAMF